MLPSMTGRVLAAMLVLGLARQGSAQTAPVSAPPVAERGAFLARLPFERYQSALGLGARGVPLDSLRALAARDTNATLVAFRARLGSFRVDEPYDHGAAEASALPSRPMPVVRAEMGALGHMPVLLADSGRMGDAPFPRTAPCRNPLNPAPTR